MKIEALLFDLDGTLVDSSEDILHCASQAFSAGGVSIDPAGLRPWLGFPLRELFQEVVGSHADETRIQAFIQCYRELYREGCTRTTLPYPGVIATLGHLREVYRLAVATTKPTGSAKQVVRAMGLDPFFEHIQGTDSGPSKPHPAVFLSALAHLKVNAYRAVVIGDTDRDVQAARNADMRVVAVGYGAWSAEHLSELAPDAVIDRFEQLPETLERLQTTP